MDMAVASTEMDEVIGEIRRSVAALCENYPGEYWREKDRIEHTLQNLFRP